MLRIALAALALAFLACACGTTSNMQDSEGNTESELVEIKVGGEIRIQGEYQSPGRTLER